MSYYTRVLGTNLIEIHAEDLIDRISSTKARIETLENESLESWSHLEIFNRKNEKLFVLEKCLIGKSEQAKNELDELREEIRSCRPESAALWLNDYFDKVIVIYSFQLLQPVFEDKNYKIYSVIRDLVWEYAGGILQSDNEGYSNEQGYHILWQFPEGAKGRWNMAILNSVGEWVGFNMNLLNIKHKAAFCDGKVPEGIYIDKGL